MKTLAGAKILITGGTGFFAKAICRYINDLDLNPRPEIVLLSRSKKDLEANYENISLSFIVADVADLSPGMFTVRFDYVIHAATTSGTSIYPSGYLSKTIIEGTKSVLEVCRNHHVRGILYVSSGAVYSARETCLPVKETDEVIEELNNTDSYSVGKRIAETICENFYQQEKIPTTIARCFTFSGEDMNLEGVFALTSFIKSAAMNKRIVVNGNGDTIRSYLDQRDLGRWLVNIMISNKGCDTVNIGSNQEVTIGDLAEKVAGNFPGCEVVYLNKEVSSYYVPSVDKVSKKYGLFQEVTLEESLSGLINKAIKKYEP